MTQTKPKKSPAKSAEAPFTDEQVQQIQAWQDNKITHDLTCGTEGCGTVLSVKKEGLFCEKCKYTQQYVPGVIVSVVAAHV